MKLKDFVLVKLNGNYIKLIAIVDIIIEAEKPLIIQIKRADANGDTLIEEIEPIKAFIDGNTLYLKTKEFSKPKLLQRVPFTVN
jgi:hypothetical protein